VGKQQDVGTVLVLSEKLGFMTSMEVLEPEPRGLVVLTETKGHQTVLTWARPYPDFHYFG
jgi:hypothetical protein